MKSIQFPDMFSSNRTNVVEDSYEATKQNLSLLLLSEQGTLWGDPFFGLYFRHYTFDQIHIDIWEDLLRDKIYTAIVNFMPQVRVKREDINLERSENKGRLTVNVKATNQSNLNLEMYNIVIIDSKDSVS